MIRVRSLLLLSVLALLGIGMVSQAEAQSRGLRRGSFLGIIGAEQVQKELKLSEEEVEKVKKLAETMRKEMGEQFGKLREIEDRQERRDKMISLSQEFDEKARSAIRKVISGEQMVRIYQIRLQLRGDLYGVNNKWVAGQLKLTDEVKRKAAELDKETQEKVFEAYSALRDLKDEERRKKYGEIREKTSKIRAEANEKALGMLNDEQKEQYEKFKGEEFKIED